MARNTTTTAEGSKADHEEHRRTVHFPNVLEREHEAIDARREEKGRPHIRPKFDRTGSQDPVYDTTGLALSGGGISLRYVLISSAIYLRGIAANVLNGCCRYFPTFELSAWRTLRCCLPS